MLDPVEFGKAMSVIVKDAIAPLLKRIEQLEARQPEKGEKGEKGDPGNDAEPVDTEALEDAIVAKLLGSERLETLVDLEATEAVARYFEENPVQDGKDGEPGRDGERGAQGDPGQKGADGKDGAGIADLLIDRDGCLVASMTDGRTKSLGVVVGKDGVAGAPGKDGRSVENFTRQYVKEKHEIVERWTDAGGEKELSYPAGGIYHRGYWQPGIEAKAAESWTHNGNLWIAMADTKDEPSVASEAWVIGARKGLDGRHGKDGKPPPGPVKLRTEAPEQ